MLSFLSNLRDVKSALSAGMLLLFAVWLQVGDDIAKVEPGDTLAGRVAILVDYLGPAVTLAVVTFVAYVLGLVLPFHLLGLTAVNRIDRKKAVREENNSQDARLFRFVLDKVKRAANKKSLDDLIWGLYREIPAFQSFSIRSPWWIRFAPPRFRSSLTGLWTRSALERGSQDRKSPGDKEPPREDRFAVRQKERKTEKQLASLLLQRIYSESALLAVDLGHKDDKAYDRFDKARGESEFRAGLCLPLLILATVVALQFPPAGFTWADLIVIGVAWGVVGVLGFLYGTGRAFWVLWAVAGVLGFLWGLSRDFGIPWGAVGVIGVGFVAAIALGLWARHKSREAQEELSGAIILGRIKVPELEVLDAVFNVTETAGHQTPISTPSLSWRGKLADALRPRR